MDRLFPLSPFPNYFFLPAPSPMILVLMLGVLLQEMPTKGSLYIGDFRRPYFSIDLKPVSKLTQITEAGTLVKGHFSWATVVFLVATSTPHTASSSSSKLSHSLTTLN